LNGAHQRRSTLRTTGIDRHSFAEAAALKQDGQYFIKMYQLGSSRPACRNQLMLYRTERKNKSIMRCGGAGYGVDWRLHQS
jgi:hypothetical protein